MKACTDLEQSKKLAEILPVESADMWWSKNFIYYNPTASIGIGTEYNDVYTYKFGEDDIPCWSLSALLELLPYEIVLDEDESLILGIHKEDLQYYINYDNTYNGEINYETSLYDNLVDACVEMILKLHKRKLL